MFDTEPPERTAFRELSTLVGHLADELASFRRRAITAENRLKELEGPANGAAGTDADPVRQRLSKAEQENAELRQRLETAADRVRQLHERVRFLRQQAQQGGAVANGGTER
jgi:chromosome segregation ATPase